MSNRNYVLNGVPSDEFHVTYVDKLQAENAKLKAERDTAVKEMVEQSKQHGYAQAEIDRLCEALEEIKRHPPKLKADLAAKDERIAELEDLAIWMTGAYPFADHEYFRKHRHLLVSDSQPNGEEMQSESNKGEDDE